MDSRTNHEIECAAYAVFKKSKKDHLKIDCPYAKDEDIEKKISTEWWSMKEKEKLPYITIVEENPNFSENNLDKEISGMDFHKHKS